MQRFYPAGASTAMHAVGLLPPSCGEPALEHASGFPGRMRAFVWGLIGMRINRFGATPTDRKARLHNLAVKLEAILGELDDLGAQRIAIDVCMALERVRLHLAADDDAATPDPDTVV